LPGCANVRSEFPCQPELCTNSVLKARSR
jgi:hypothetical protein